MKTYESDFERIYDLWHIYASTCDVKNLIDLYADEAIFESPLVPVILKKETGILHGRKEIQLFLEEGTKRRPNNLVRWYRTGTYFCKNNTLIWEYPRQTPDGNQIDILELMEIINGKIVNHRIYWGWFGTKLLLENKTKAILEQGDLK